MYNLNEKIQEIEYNISKLKSTAKKHLDNKDFYKYKIICNTILDNEKQLALFKKELSNTRNKNLCLTVR